MEGLLEMRARVLDRPAEWEARWRRAAIAEGLREGLQEGRRAGEATLLSRLLQRRFGDLSEAAKAHIAAAGLPDLEEWGLRLLDAKSIDEVFG
jgi:hypothetical protein